MSKLSIKLAVCFLVTILLLEGLLMMYLHPNIEQARLEEEYTRQLDTGANHREVLEDNFSTETIHHILLMESRNDRGVALLDEEQQLVDASSQISEEWQQIASRWEFSTIAEDTILQKQWKGEPYLISAHPFVAETGESGTLVMLQSTSAIQKLMDTLNFHFLLAGIGSLLVLGVIYILLTHFLTHPLARMKVATEKLSKGDFNVVLPIEGKDELGELAASIQKLARDLEHLQKNRTEFLSSISHELRTPLTYLAGYSQVAMRPDVQPAERQRYLEIIREETIRLTALIEDLFELAKLEDPSFRVVKEEIEMEPFIQRICQRLAPSFEQQNSHLLYSTEPDVIVYADPLRLEQILVNLLDNARRYGGKGVDTEVRVHQEGTKTRITVTDQGPGMEESELDAIFDRLYRVEKSRSRSHGGSGLGLSIVKELVEAHGGTIDVKSEGGKGTTFSILL
ncbi:sensor histidine kinase [Chryseomicrobium aureum]|uniref:sensor histidine kinase n=1 Tax=Chryseomicrobium aureum TaxID=1441723 RepID=UPI00370D8668